MTIQQAALFALPKPAPKTKRKGAPAAPTAPFTHSRDGATWTLTFPAPAKMLSANHRIHRMAASKNRKQWREAVVTYARAAKLPRDLTRVRIGIELRFPTKLDRDPPNYHGNVAKPCVDALGPGRRYRSKGAVVVEPGHGVIPDDNPRYLHCQECPHLRIGPATGRNPAAPYGQVVITITDLTQETPPCP